ncbi:MAG TPA: hypothetical protein HA366_01560 [Candidatus Methanomethylophilaceae archaeon]|nr:hypothetical protein [Candidatus Methanomethylophilaceae archaeon]HIJ00201.1 hypothetical protein [Candidatus Methanomethylophilaceae archaeon]
MYLSLETRAALFIVFATSVVLILYLQLKYFRNWGSKRIDAKLERDDLYNSIVTIKAVTQSLLSRGCDIGKAEELADMAVIAFDRRDNILARELLDRAKNEINNSSKDMEENPFRVGKVASDPGLPRPNESEISIQTRFLISRALSISDDENILSMSKQAQTALANGEEEMALSLAYRCNKSAEILASNQDELR